MMKKITVYSSSPCPWCSRAKALLKQQELAFEEIHIDFDSKEFDELIERTKMQTVPQIFVDDVLLGGFEELKKAIEEGTLV
ncbi:MAG: glutaredoxin [Eubacteriaceae bacterium]|jgi:glutaredoxin 3|nr:glutaredoxin [Eubacteriaceae bacterium]